MAACSGRWTAPGTSEKRTRWGSRSRKGDGKQGLSEGGRCRPLLPPGSGQRNSSVCRRFRNRRTLCPVRNPGGGRAGARGLGGRTRPSSAGGTGRAGVWATGGFQGVPRARRPGREPWRLCVRSGHGALWFWNANHLRTGGGPGSFPPTKTCNPEQTKTPVSRPPPSSWLTQTQMAPNVGDVVTSTEDHARGDPFQRRTHNSGTRSTGWGEASQRYQYFSELL